MKTFRLTLALLAASSMGVLAAHADTFSFTFGTTANAFNGSGTLTGTPITPVPGDVAEYQITAVTGTTNTGNGTNRPISGILPPNYPLFSTNDNLLFETSPGVFNFDDLGLSYSLNNGALINIFLQTNSGTQDAEILQRAGGVIVFETAPYSISQVTPEPGSFLLLGTGLLGAAGAMRRRLFA